MLHLLTMELFSESSLAVVGCAFFLAISRAITLALQLVHLVPLLLIISVWIIVVLLVFQVGRR